MERNCTRDECVSRGYPPPPRRAGDSRAETCRRGVPATSFTFFISGIKANEISFDEIIYCRARNNQILCSVLRETSPLTLYGLNSCILSPFCLALELFIALLQFQICLRFSYCSLRIDRCKCLSGEYFEYLGWNELNHLINDILGIKIQRVPSRLCKSKTILEKRIECCNTC